VITIVEPQESIAKLWGKQRIRDGDTYRMMKYVLRVNHDDKVLLHNVVTGRLVVLNKEEAAVVEKLPKAYNTVMEQLVTEHYLVPESYDEHQQVKALRSVLRMLGETQASNDITFYTILPTTACNARCYYCFEKGAKHVTMSEQTASEVVKFITEHCGEKKTVRINWFGGEPTLAHQRIEQICTGLYENGVEFSSSITTNGYLLDEEMIRRATTIWHLKTVSIAMDGTEERYNRTKAYIDPKDNPYQRVMRNIGSLLAEGIHVNLRMNFDMHNYQDFRCFVKDVKNRFGETPLLGVTAHQINGEHLGCEQDMPHGTEAWFSEMIVELNDIVREAGLYRRKFRLPSLASLGCKASMNSTVTITPAGNLVRCPEQFGEDQTTGNVRDGIIDQDRILSWKRLVDYKRCHDCVFYPRCLRVMNCSVGERCSYKMEFHRLYQDLLVQQIVADPNEAKNKGGM
jgi:radical SAM protein with 4Fe4S-binding SPASM domain